MIQEAVDNRAEDSATDVGKVYQVLFNMPKLKLSLHQSAKKSPKNHRMPMAVLTMEGVSVEVKIETMPDKIDIKFCLASLEVEDHRVREAVKLKNPGLTDDILISEKVLETWKKPNL